MNYQICDVSGNDKEALADLRIDAMKESLIAIGRFDPERARSRFLDKFSITDTKKIICENELLGFYEIKNKTDHLYLNHLYIKPSFQNSGLGSKILSNIKSIASNKELSIRLGALRGSKSNDFYKNHGFVYTHEEEWDIYYEFKNN